MRLRRTMSQGRPPHQRPMITGADLLQISLACVDRDRFSLQDFVYLLRFDHQSSSSAPRTALPPWQGDCLFGVRSVALRLRRSLLVPEPTPRHETPTPAVALAQDHWVARVAAALSYFRDSMNSRWSRSFPIEYQPKLSVFLPRSTRPQQQQQLIRSPRQQRLTFLGSKERMKRTGSNQQRAPLCLPGSWGMQCMS